MNRRDFIAGTVAVAVIAATPIAAAAMPTAVETLPPIGLMTFQQILGDMLRQCRNIFDDVRPGSRGYQLIYSAAESIWENHLHIQEIMRSFRVETASHDDLERRYGNDLVTIGKY